MPKFKVLVYAGNYIDNTLLAKGIYGANIPKLYSLEETIESLIEKAPKAGFFEGQRIVSKSYIENLKKCSLVTVNIEQCE